MLPTLWLAERLRSGCQSLDVNSLKYPVENEKYFNWLQKENPREK